jgi:prepilin-type processing-associated H-X9-DG protein/prepilin-type N-terminal cleavage/methylation domain-containing protein
MRREAFTLIEIVVVIAVLAIVMALLLPAIFASRRAVARIDCVSRLHQIGVAMSAYTAKWDVLPPRSLRDPGKKRPAGPWSVHVILLPELEQAALYNSLNLQLFWGSSENSTVARMSPGVYLCPDDASPQASRYGFVNYAACVGSGLFSGGLDAEAHSEPGNGLFCGQTLKPSDCTDGLSHTAAFSEMIHGGAARGTGPAGSEPVPANLKDLGVVHNVVDVQPPTQRRLLQLCALPRIPGSSAEPAGRPWMQEGYYTHLQTPNLKSCFGGGGKLGGFLSPITASSRHSGGVNVLFGDGHVRLVEQNIDVDLWRALGSRNGGETTPGF